MSSVLTLPRESLLSRSGFFIERFSTGAAWGRSSLFEGGFSEEDEEPVDSHSNDSVPLSPRLELM